MTTEIGHRNRGSAFSACCLALVAGVLACSSSDSSAGPNGGTPDAGHQDAQQQDSRTDTATDQGGSDVAPDAAAGDFFDDARDGHRYSTIGIGGATWMGENLAYESAGSFCYANDPANCESGGRLYTFAAAGTACPPGWHLSTDNEWKAIESFLGMPAAALDADGYSIVRGTDEGTRLKQGGSSGLDFPMTGYATVSGTQASGFDGLTSGVIRTYIWTSTSGGAGVFRRRIEQNDPHAFRFSNAAGGFAITVRCVAD